ncbi:MAG: DUF4173 domain-containing protein [Raineya sp.]|jgi:hypothetical protein|nr:DUF4173 domain-containing protein [Raineya sp.]
MFHKKILQPLFLVILTLLHNVFFWEEDLGLNGFLFGNLVLGVVIYLYCPRPYIQFFKSNPLILLFVVGTFLMNGILLYHNTLNSKITWVISLIATIAYLQNHQLKQFFNALIFYFINGVSSLKYLLPTLKNNLKGFSPKSNKLKTYNRKVGLLAVPIIIFVVFYCIFLFANPVFASYNEKFLIQIDKFFAYFFKNISLIRILFGIWGLWLVSSFIYRWKVDTTFTQISIPDKFQIERRPNKLQIGRLFKTLDLKNEAQIALLTIGSVNALLLFINFIDIRFLWFGFVHSEDVRLAKLVHEGTYILIFSILLSMGILFYYFRQNLNFYTRNKTLQKVAYLWLFQNGILLISVLLRCYYYIQEHGLAYKRIGVILFLTLTLIGLISVYYKIKAKKTAYYLLHVNSIALYVLLLFTSFVNWDVLIVSFNFNHPNLNKGSIDIPFILSRSHSTIPIVQANAHKLNMDAIDESEYYFGQISRKYFVDKLKGEFLYHYKTLSWLSWNYTSDKVYKQLSKK